MELYSAENYCCLIVSKRIETFSSAPGADVHVATVSFLGQISLIPCLLILILNKCVSLFNAIECRHLKEMQKFCIFSFCALSTVQNKKAIETS